MVENYRKGEFFKAQLRKGWEKRKAKGLGIPWNKNLRGIHISPATEFKVGFRHTEATKVKFKNRVGPLSPAWKGGTTPKGTLIRSRPEYKQWRTAVFTRDDFTCQMCGARGVELHADHIKPFALFPKLRTVISNGRTLCVPCHKKTPTYLRRMPSQILVSP